MLRRALLLAVLLAPAAGRAQTLSSDPPGPFSAVECSSVRPAIKLTWSLASSVGTPLTGWTYRILASTSDTCTVAASDANVVKGNIPAGGSLSGSYPATGSSDTLSLGDLQEKSGAVCTSGPAIYACVQLVKEDGTTVAGNSGTVKLQIEADPPPAPTITSVAPGGSALTVYWTEGTATSTSAAVDHYLAEAYACADQADLVCGTVPAAAAQTGSSTVGSLRISPLDIGTKYKVLVYAVSASGLQSDPSAPGYETPIKTKDFWDQYQEDAGASADPGGCGGGPAGLASLLAVAGLLGARRRRP